MVFINLKIRVTLIHNSLNRRNRNIVLFSNKSKRNIFLKFLRNSIFKVMRNIRVIFSNTSKKRKSFFTIFTDMPLYTKIKFNIVILKRDKFNITFLGTIFNNIFRIAMRTRTIIRFKKPFKNFN